MTVQGFDVDDLMTAWGLLTDAVVTVSTRLAPGLESAGSLSLPKTSGRSCSTHSAPSGCGPSPA